MVLSNVTSDSFNAPTLSKAALAVVIASLIDASISAGVVSNFGMVRIEPNSAAR